jgi:hypothetical protein
VRQQLLVPAALHNPPTIYYADQIRVVDRAQPVRDYSGRTLGQHRARLPQPEGNQAYWPATSRAQLVSARYTRCGFSVTSVSRCS